MRQESGRSMIEMLGVLAIMGIITVGAVLIIKNAMNIQRRTTVSDEVFQIVTNVRQLLAGYDDFSHIDNEIIFDAIGMSSINRYNNVYSLSTDPNNSRQFIIKIDKLSASDCSYYIAKAWTDSVGYQISDGQSGGATGYCNNPGNSNYVEISYGE